LDFTGAACSSSRGFTFFTADGEAGFLAFLGGSAGLADFFSAGTAGGAFTSFEGAVSSSSAC